MRLHLPKRLLHAVLTALVTTPAALFTLGSSAYAGVSGVNFYTNTSEDNSAASMVDYASFGDGKYTYVNTDPEGKTAVTTIKPGDSLSGTITVLNVASDKVLNIVTNSESSTSKLFTNLSIESINVADSGSAKLVIDGAQVVSIGGATGTVNFEAKSGGEAQLIFDGSGNYGTYATIGTSDNYDRKLSVTNSSIVNFTTITNSWGMGAIEVETNSQLTATTISFKSGDKRSGDGQGGKITGAGTVKVGTFETGNVGNYTVNVGKFEVTTINAACAADKTLTLSSANLTVGTLNQTQGKVVLDSANAAISNLLFNGGTLTNSGTLRITGKFKGGTLTNTGTITFASGCVIDISGMTFETRFFDSAESDGYVDCRAAHQVVSGTAATNQGVIIKNGDTEVAGASFDGTYVYNTADRGYLLMDNDSYDTSTLKSGNGAEGSVGVASEASYLKIASGKTLTVNSTDWTLDKIYGEGNVSIASNLEYSAGPSKATGRLDIASDVQLTIGGGTRSNANLNSFTSISIDGGTLKLNFKQGTFNNVTVSANGGTINFYDSGSATTQQTFAGTTTLNGKLNIQSGYKVLANFQNVTGSGEVSITGYTPGWAHEAATYNFALQNTYTGTIDLNDSLATVNVSGTLGAATLKKTSGVALNYSGAEINGTTLDAVTLTKSDGYVTVKGASTIKNIINRTLGGNYGYSIVVADGGSLSVQGINDFTATTTSGDTTTSYNGLVGVVSGGSLTVEEDAVLTVKGLFNSANYPERNGNVTLKVGGTLNVVGSGSKTYVNNLTIGGSGEKTTAATFDGTVNVNSTLSIANGGSVETKGESTITTLIGSGTLKVSNDTSTVTDASAFTGTLEATGGKLEATTTGSPTIAALTADGGDIDVFGVTSLTVKDMVIGDGSTVGVYSGADASSTEGGLNISGSADAKASLTIGSGATLNTNLSLWNAKLTFQDGALAMGSSLTLILDGSSELYINIGTMEANESLTLFTGVDQFQASANAATIDEASKVFGNLTAGDFKLTYSGADNGGIVALVAKRDVPEPTTATLSLLALMGLAARRRRRKA